MYKREKKQLRSRKKEFKNIALIETANAIGSGIILPCNWEGENRKPDDTLYCIFTNMHTISEYMEGRSDICITVYDLMNKKIELRGEDIEDKYMEYSPFPYEDIAVLMVAIPSKFQISRDIRVNYNLIQETDEIYTVGFPGALQSGNVVVPTAIEGICQISYQENAGLCTYRFQEGFHYYKDSADEDFYAGMSGGAVIYTDPEGEVLIGINQSIWANVNGDNPYRLVNYISIMTALDYLRREGCLLYDIDDNKLSLMWIKDVTDSKNNGSNELDIIPRSSFLVLGSSGAGKSSFTSGFSRSTSKLSFEGDGQTTRTDIFYFLCVENCIPEIHIRFLDEKTYAAARYKEAILDVICCIFRYRYRISINEIKLDGTMFLKESIDYIRYILEKLEPTIVSLGERNYKKLNENLLEISDTIKYYDKNEESDELEKSYLRLLSIIEFLYTQCNIKRKKLQLLFDIDERNKFIYRTYILNKEDHVEQDSSETFYMLMEQLDKHMKNVSLNSGNFRLDEKSIEAYTAYILDKDFGDIDQEDMEDEQNIDKRIMCVLEKQEGYFDYAEYSYLLDGCDSFGNWIGKLLECETAMIGKQIYDKIVAEIAEFQVELQTLNKMFVACYKDMRECVKKYYAVDIDQNYERNLDGLTADEIDFINICLTVFHQKSLTSFVARVDIIDLISDEYAYMFYKAGIQNILFIDTCGLDHIEKDKNIGRVLNSKLKKYSIVKENGKYYLNSIIYIKKLDSGHPTEIQDILPYVVDNTGLAFYCVFNGNDIYEATNAFFPANRDWHLEKDDEGYPQIIRYLKNEDNKNELFQYCKANKQRINSVYRVLKNNIITYCSNRNMTSAKPFYRQNNRYGLKMILTSIALDEININNYASKNVKHFKKRLKAERDEIGELLTIWFDIASMRKWGNYYYNTIWANLSRIIGNKKSDIIGYCGSYDHRWSTLFTRAYNRTINIYAEKFLKSMDDFSDITHTLMNKLPRESFDISLDDENMRNEKNKHKYVLNYILFKMCETYGRDHVEFVNPYCPESNKAEIVLKKKDNSSSKTLEVARMMDIQTDFGKMIRYCENEKEELINLFIEILVQDYIRERRESQYDKVEIAKPEWNEKIMSVFNDMEQNGFNRNTIFNILKHWLFTTKIV